MNENYKYTILINQFAAIENDLDLDIIDLAIFDYIKDFSGSNYCSKIATPEGTYFWLSHKKIIQDLPLLKIKSSQGIIKRIANLINNGIFEKHPNCELYGKTLYKAGVNYDLLIFGKSVDTPQRKFRGGQTEVDGTPQQEFRVPPNESLGYYNINDNIIIDNNINTKDEFFSKNSPEAEIRYLWDNFKGKKNSFDKDFKKFVEKTEGLEVNFKKLRSEINNTKDVYFQTWVNKKFPKSTKSTTTNISGEKNQSLHQIIIDVYFDWFKQRNDSIAPKIDGAEAKAAKTLANYFKSLQKQFAPDTTEEEMPEKIEKMFLRILNNWDNLEPFLQKQVKLIQINSNITNIVNYLKNGKQATNNNYNKQPVTEDTIASRFANFSTAFGTGSNNAD